VSFDFSFGKRFGDELTPEQREIVDQLERGEISEQEARDRLGADVSLFFHELQLGCDDEGPRSADPPPAETDEQARARELVERIAREVDAETGASGRPDRREPAEERRAIAEGLMLGDVAPEEAARRLGELGHTPRHPVTADAATIGESVAGAADVAARLVADVVREVELAESRESRQEWRAGGTLRRIALGALGVLAFLALLTGDEGPAHVATSALVAACSFIFFLVLGVPLAAVTRRRPLVPSAAIWGALAMLAWGLLLTVTGNWSSYMPSILVVGFLVALAVAAAATLGVARRAEETMDLMRDRGNARR
jgi:hypothetical protein